MLITTEQSPTSPVLHANSVVNGYVIAYMTCLCFDEKRRTAAAAAARVTLTLVSVNVISPLRIGLT